MRRDAGERWSRNAHPVSVLMLGHGAPAPGGPGRAGGASGIESFLERLMAPRRPTQNMIAEVERRYRIIGGTSPLIPNTRAQARALETYLRGRGRLALDHAAGGWTRARVFVGMRYSAPALDEAVTRALDYGDGEAVGLIMASHVPPSSQQRYEAQVRAAVGEWSRRRERPGRVTFVPPWHLAPTFVRSVAGRLVAGPARGRFGWIAEDEDAAGTQVIFSAHSVPEREGDTRYEDALRETMEAVMGVVGVRVPAAHARLGFQGRRRSGDWLGPSVEEVAAESREAGMSKVLLVPLGFLSEHLETLYDLDVDVAAKVRGLGLEYARLLTSGTLPSLMRTLAQAVTEAVTGSAAGVVREE